MRLICLIICLVILSCGSCHKAEEKETVDVDKAISDLNEFYENRLMRDFQHNGWVASYWKDSGNLDFVGEGAIWTGIAIGAVNCNNAHFFINAISKSIDITQGFILRFNPLPEEYLNGNEAQIDGDLGVMYGLARYVQKCGPESIIPMWVKHVEAVVARDYEIFPNTGHKIPVGYRYPWIKFAESIDIYTTYEDEEKSVFEAEIIGQAVALKKSHASCYRMHLAHLGVKTLEILGDGISENARNMYCEQTRGFDIPELDWYCGRLDARDWLINKFRENEWEYRHQRCGSWEMPLDEEGLLTPALDWLVMYDQAVR